MDKSLLYVILPLPLVMALYTSADYQADINRAPANVDTVVPGGVTPTDDETKSLPVKKEFSIWMNKRVVADFVKTDSGWKNKDPKAYTNWKFFEDFLDSLQDFHVDFHLPAENVQENAASFELREGGRTFLFAKVGDRTWAVKWPGTKEFLASRNFSIYGDMDASTWASPFEKSLRLLKDPTATPEARITALRSVKDAPSQDVKNVMRDILINEGESPELRQDIVNAMRQQPTDENIKVLMSVLKKSKNEILLNLISKALRVRNPKGPVIQVDDEDHEIQRKIAAWQAWGGRFK